MRFKTAIAAFLLPVALLLGACGANVTAGTVTDKEYTEAYQTEEEITEQVCEKEKRTTGTGKNKKTSYVNECEDEPTGEFETVDHPAEYTLTLEDSDYNSVEVGDYFDSEAAN
jgi:major membrane immunogen (membrane-anchored lipoprotein)